MINNLRIHNLTFGTVLLVSGISLFSCNTDANQPKAGPAQEIMGGLTYAPIDSAETLPDSIIRKGIYYQESLVVEDEVISMPPVETLRAEIAEPDIVDTVPIIDDDFFYDEMPQFPGGQEAFRRYIKDSVRYPQSARNESLSGKVYVSFKVTETGKIDSVRLLRGFYDSCDMEALRVIRAMPDWIPAKHNGKPISVQFNLPIIFTMQ